MDISKIQAKQKVCENFLRVMLETKLSERYGNLKVLNFLTFNNVHIPNIYILYMNIYILSYI